MENCDTVCAKNGLICTEAEFFANNNDVDSSDEVLALIKNLGGTTAAKSCSKKDFPAVPLFNEKDICMYSNGLKNNRSNKFDCQRVAGPPEDNKQRLCYCHEPSGISISSLDKLQGKANNQPVLSTV